MAKTKLPKLPLRGHVSEGLVTRGMFSEPIWAFQLLLTFYAMMNPGVLEMELPFLGEAIFLVIMTLLVHPKLTGPLSNYISGIVEPPIKIFKKEGSEDEYKKYKDLNYRQKAATIFVSFIVHDIPVGMLELVKSTSIYLMKLVSKPSSLYLGFKKSYIEIKGQLSGVKTNPVWPSFVELRANPNLLSYIIKFRWAMAVGLGLLLLTASTTGLGAMIHLTPLVVGIISALFLIPSSIVPLAVSDYRKDGTEDQQNRRWYGSWVIIIIFAALNVLISFFPGTIANIIPLDLILRASTIFIASFIFGPGIAFFAGIPLGRRINEKTENNPPTWVSDFTKPLAIALGFVVIGAGVLLTILGLPGIGPIHITDNLVMGGMMQTGDGSAGVFLPAFGSLLRLPWYFAFFFNIILGGAVILGTAGYILGIGSQIRRSLFKEGKVREAFEKEALEWLNKDFTGDEKAARKYMKDNILDNACDAENYAMNTVAAGRWIDAVWEKFTSERKGLFSAIEVFKNWSKKYQGAGIYEINTAVDNIIEKLKLSGEDAALLRSIAAGAVLACARKEFTDWFKVKDNQTAAIDEINAKVDEIIDAGVRSKEDVAQLKATADKDVLDRAKGEFTDWLEKNREVAKDIINAKRDEIINKFKLSGKHADKLRIEVVERVKAQKQMDEAAKTISSQAIKSFKNWFNLECAKEEFIRWFEKNYKKVTKDEEIIKKKNEIIGIFKLSKEDTDKFRAETAEDTKTQDRMKKASAGTLPIKIEIQKRIDIIEKEPKHLRLLDDTLRLEDAANKAVLTRAKKILEEWFKEKDDDAAAIIDEIDGIMEYIIKKFELSEKAAVQLKAEADIIILNHAKGLLAEWFEVNPAATLDEINAKADEIIGEFRLLENKKSIDDFKTKIAAAVLNHARTILAKWIKENPAANIEDINKKVREIIDDYKISGREKDVVHFRAEASKIILNHARELLIKWIKENPAVTIDEVSAMMNEIITTLKFPQEDVSFGKEPAQPKATVIEAALNGAKKLLMKWFRVKHKVTTAEINAMVNKIIGEGMLSKEETVQFKAGSVMDCAKELFKKWLKESPAAAIVEINAEINKIVDNYKLSKEASVKFKSEASNIILSHAEELLMNWFKANPAVAIDEINAMLDGSIERFGFSGKTASRFKAEFFINCAKELLTKWLEENPNAAMKEIKFEKNEIIGNLKLSEEASVKFRAEASKIISNHAEKLLMSWVRANAAAAKDEAHAKVMEIAGRLGISPKETRRLTLKIMNELNVQKQKEEAPKTAPITMRAGTPEGRYDVATAKVIDGKLRNYKGIDNGMQAALSTLLKRITNKDIEAKVIELLGDEGARKGLLEGKTLRIVQGNDRLMHFTEGPDVITIDIDALKYSELLFMEFIHELLHAKLAAMPTRAGPMEEEITVTTLEVELFLTFPQDIQNNILETLKADNDLDDQQFYKILEKAQAQGSAAVANDIRGYVIGLTTINQSMTAEEIWAALCATEGSELPELKKFATRPGQTVFDHVHGLIAFENELNSAANMADVVQGEARAMEAVALRKDARSDVTTGKPSVERLDPAKVVAFTRYYSNIAKGPDGARKLFLLRLAIALHDIGKVEGRGEDRSAHYRHAAPVIGKLHKDGIITEEEARLVLALIYLHDAFNTIHFGEVLPMQIKEYLQRPDVNVPEAKYYELAPLLYIFDVGSVGSGVISDSHLANAVYLSNPTNVENLMANWDAIRFYEGFCGEGNKVIDFSAPLGSTVSFSLDPALSSLSSGDRERLRKFLKEKAVFTGQAIFIFRHMNELAKSDPNKPGALVRFLLLMDQVSAADPSINIMHFTPTGNRTTKEFAELLYDHVRNIAPNIAIPDSSTQNIAAQLGLPITVKDGILTINTQSAMAAKEAVAEVRPQVLPAAEETKPLEITDIGTTGTHNDKYRDRHTKSRILVDIVNGRYIKITYNNGELQIAGADIGKNASPIDHVLQDRLSNLNKSEVFKKFLNDNKDLLGNLSFYLLEADTDSKRSKHPHVLTVIGDQYDFAWSGTHDGREQAVYTTRAFFTDIDMKLIIDVLKNQILLASVRYDAWQKSKRLPFGDINSKKVREIMARLREAPVIKKDLKAIYRYDIEISRVYFINMHTCNEIIRLMKKVKNGMPDFAPAAMNYETALRFKEAIAKHDFDSAIHEWGILTYDLRDLASSNDRMSKELLEKKEVELFLGLARGINNIFNKYILNQGVSNQEGLETGKVVGKVRVVADPANIEEEFKNAKGDEIWVIPYLPFRSDIPGVGCIISIAGNRHAIDSAKVQGIPLAVVPNAVELLRDFELSTGMLRVDSDGSAHFRKAFQRETGTPAAKEKVLIAVPKAKAGEKLIYKLDEVDRNFVSYVGPKAANLGEMISNGVDVPEGIVPTVAFWDKFSKYNRLDEKIAALRQKIEVKSGKIVTPPDKVRETLAEIKKVIMDSSFPNEIKESLFTEINKMRGKYGKASFYVRSSFNFEDLPENSMAGHYESYPSDEQMDTSSDEGILRAIKLVFASKWNEIAFNTRVSNRIDDRDVEPALIIQVPVKAKYAGIMYTADPVSSNFNKISMMAGHGQGAGVVDKKGRPAEVSADKMLTVDQGTWVIQETSRVPRAYRFKDGIIEDTYVTVEEQREPIFTHELISTLKEAGERIEGLYGFWPQDIEWVLDQSGRLWIVQSRPMRTNVLAADNMISNGADAKVYQVDEATLIGLKESLREPANPATAEKLINALHLDIPTRELISKMPAKYGERVASARYLKLMAGNQGFANTFTPEMTSALIKNISQDRKAIIVDAGAMPQMLAALRKIALNSDNTEVKEAIKEFFIKYLGTMKTAAVSHTINIEIAKALVGYREYDLALTKLRLAENCEGQPDVADLTIKVLADIPTKGSIERLEGFLSTNGANSWVAEYARRVINRLKISMNEAESAAARKAAVSEAYDAALKQKMLLLPHVPAVLQLTAPEFIIALPKVNEVTDAKNMQIIKDTIEGVPVLKGIAKIEFVSNIDAFNSRIAVGNINGIFLDLSMLEKGALKELQNVLNEVTISASVILISSRTREELERILKDIAATLDEIAKFDIDEAARAQRGADYKDQLQHKLARQIKALKAALADRKEVVAPVYNSTPFVDKAALKAKTYALATTEKVALSNMFAADNMQKAGEMGVINCFVYGEILKTEGEARAFLRASGYEGNIDNVKFVDKRGLSYEGLRTAIMTKTGVEAVNMGVAYAKDELGAVTSVKGEKLLEMKEIDMGGVKVVASINYYQTLLKMVTTSAELLEKMIADGELPGVALKDGEKSIFTYLPKALPIDYGREIETYRNAVNAIRTAA